LTDSRITWRIACKTATINDPKQIDPNDVVVARTNDGHVAIVADGLNHQVATTPAVVVCPILRKTSSVQ